MSFDKLFDGSDAHLLPDAKNMIEQSTQAPDASINDDNLNISEREFDELLGQYWGLAYSEGACGKSHGDKANEVLHKLRQARAQVGQVERQAVPDGLEEVTRLLGYAIPYRLNCILRGECVESSAAAIHSMCERISSEIAASPQAIPDGWKLVPDDQNMTDDQGEAIAKLANCCGGIAYDIYHAALAAAPTPEGAK